MTIPTASPRRAFVTGGSGFVGSHLVRALLRDGWQVRAQGRSTAARASLAAMGAEAVCGDLNDGRALRRDLPGCEVVFHVAAHFKLWGPRRVFEQVNIEGTRQLVDAAAATPDVRRVVMVSAAAVVMGHPEPMRGVTEAAPLQFMDFAPYSTSKARAEQLLLAANRQRPGFETIAVRPPFIWGAGMPTLEHLVETVRRGRFTWVNGGAARMSSCHVGNLVEALIRAADHGQPGQAYFVTDGEDTTLKAFISDLLATCGVVAPEKAITLRAAWRAAGVMAAAWQLLPLPGEPPITRQMLRLIGEDFTIDVSKIRDAMGYAPRIGRVEGLEEMRQLASAGSTGFRPDFLVRNKDEVALLPASQNGAG